eukprot:scaffold10660_cov27-Tisochrysis_lutea.AAC.4
MALICALDLSTARSLGEGASSRRSHMRRTPSLSEDINVSRKMKSAVIGDLWSPNFSVLSSGRLPLASGGWSSRERISPLSIPRKALAHFLAWTKR